MWLFLAGAIGRCSESTLASSELISKVYFPRIVVPVAALAAPIVDFAAAFVVLLAILLVTGARAGPEVLLVPVVFAMALADRARHRPVAVGAGRALPRRQPRGAVPDPRAAVLTPILYPLSLVPDEYQTLYSLNPLVGVMETFRWTLLADAPAPGVGLLVSAATGAVAAGHRPPVLRRAEQRFADVI